MKRSDFIKKVLKSKKNTVFTNKEQVENSLEIFESLGMLPPEIKNPELPKDMSLFQHATEKILENKYNKTIKLPEEFYANKWESEDGSN